ncbi:Repair protein Rad1 [Venustampulla echinocandica]|uniref:Repair protein Rad1 n=1 Tax=Venustampulla echinocandica TaxID=2656787 RepID=A0A370U3P3_9HELO|nr:Repair protein Rad1 [Venustampulla echinocandica]RDL42395.1 Repair protein Rad1 [Venustampulla echinocandica]
MESSLHQVWESASGNPFVPTIGKGSQFFVGFSLLTIGLLLSGLFGLNRSVINISAIGIPASLAIATLHSIDLSFPMRVRMSSIRGAEDDTPIFKAVSGSARQLFQLLNCIRFAPKAQVQISSEGLRFAVEESRVIQDKALFTTFNCALPESDASEDGPRSASPDLPSFQISLSALLETLQIFGAADAMNARVSKPDNDGYTTNIRRDRPNAFSNQALGMAGVCRLSYQGLGSPFSIILEESGVTTTCNLTTYEPEAPEEIPFQRDDMQVKIIMQARWLFDAVTELSSTSPSRLDITAFPAAPFFSLSAIGHLGSASVEFSKGRELLETFTVAEKWTQSYKFEMVKAAAEAMRLASKVSVRGDEQGVLSLQFMVEVDGGGVSFVDFRFVPFLRDEDDEPSQDSADEYENEGEEN